MSADVSLTTRIAAGEHKMPTTVQLEAHPLDVQPGNYCHSCRAHTVTHVRVAIVASDSLRVLGHVDAEACASCDRLEVTR